MPVIRSKTHVRLPATRFGVLAVAIAVLLLVGGVIFLALFEPAPPRRHFEVPVPNERFAR